MKYLPHLFLLFIGIISCSSPNSTIQVEEDISKKIKEEVHGLKTVESQRIFLEDIHYKDQKVRTNSQEAELKFGYKSKEDLATNERMRNVDAENIAKIEEYLSVHGHPTIAEHGKIASLAPWLVVHHIPDDDAFSIRQRNFKYLYEAVIKEDLDERAFRLYLYRWHNHKFGRDIEWNRPYKPQEDMDSLIRALNLQEIARAVELKFEEEI